MKAAVFHAAQDVRIEDVEEPEPLPGQVKLKCAYVGICGTDLHVYYDPDSSGIDYSQPNPLTHAQLPQVLGHEFSGTVVALGDGVERLAPGDRVAVFPQYCCGACVACQRGLTNVCRNAAYHGLNAPGGGLATYTIVPEGQCHLLPDAVDLRLGALVEPMAVSWQAVRTCEVSKGRTALIIGAGPIGIGVLFALRTSGVDRILLSEPNVRRRDALSGIGVTGAHDPSSGNLNSWVLDRTEGRGVDYVFDAAGVGQALADALPALTPGGQAVVVAVHSEGFEFNPVSLVLSGTKLIGINAYLPQDFADVIDAMSRGVYTTNGWIDVVELDDVVGAMERLHAGLGVKVLVRVEA
jgi:(R,R)-butanediol dehydrogenase/meso-butanediol dehydrogenase/diacetyl reductase